MPETPERIDDESGSPPLFVPDGTSTPVTDAGDTLLGSCCCALDPALSPVLVGIPETPPSAHVYGAGMLSGSLIITFYVVLEWDHCVSSFYLKTCQGPVILVTGVGSLTEVCLFNPLYFFSHGFLLPARAYYAEIGPIPPHLTALGFGGIFGRL